MKNTLLYSLVLLFCITGISCNDDCENVDCGIYGSCDRGACDCLPTVYGEFCNQYERDQFLGHWSSTSVDCTVGNSVPTTFRIVRGATVHQVELTNLMTEEVTLTAEIDSNIVTIPVQVVTSTVSVVYSGIGTVDGTGLDLQIDQMVEDTAVRTCTYQLELE